MFTKNWTQVRHFYTHLLGGRVVSERLHRYCDLLLGGMPVCFRVCENGEGVSHFHLYFATDHRDVTLERLREAGVIVRFDGAYACFLDPDGRTIKMSEGNATVG